MKIEFIELYNFRQLKEAKIEFSTDNEKNVTIIMGNNGAGKTTLSQAFTWCLYGETSFKIKSVLNKDKERKLSANSSVLVTVKIGLEHNGIKYELERNGAYKKRANGSVVGDPTTVLLTRKTKDGLTVTVKDWEKELREILPQELSKYFFFDGERIEKMSKEVQGGKRSSEFADAVRGLLGLNAIMSAIDHLKPGKKYSVVGLYEDKQSSTNNNEINKTMDDINQTRIFSEKLEKRLKEISEQEENDKKLILSCNEKLKEYEESRKLQNEREKYEENKIKLEQKKENKIQNLLKDFNNLNYSYFTQYLIKDTIKDLVNLKYEEKSIPELSSKVIRYLMEHHICICGRELVEGSAEWNKLKELLEYLPPKSLGTLIGSFIKESRLRTKQKNSLSQNISEKNREINDFQKEIDDITDTLRALDEKLSGKDVAKIISELVRDRKNAETDLNILQREKEEKKEKKVKIDYLLEGYEQRLKKLNLANKENRRIEVYKTYAIEVYKALTKKLDEKEKQLRISLEQEINDIFKTIYNGGLSLDIDENYGIRVHASNFETETSTAQSISVIFAFIGGIIKLAREYQNNENKELTSEPYPLVMDAPLSAFDKQRIKKVCEVLPGIAEQVIIFIKDTDGDLARENLVNKIGKIKFIKKIDEFNSVVE